MNESLNISINSQGGMNKYATRLTFTYEGDKIALISQQTMKMTPPPSDVLTPDKQESGFWYELRDANNNTCFRRVIQTPIRHYIEVRSDDPDRPFTWEKVENPSGTFTLLVPVIQEAKEILFFSSHLHKEIFIPAEEIARFTLEDDENRKEK